MTGPFSPRRIDCREPWDASETDPCALATMVSAEHRARLRPTTSVTRSERRRADPRAGSDRWPSTREGVGQSYRYWRGIRPPHGNTSPTRPPRPPMGARLSQGYPRPIGRVASRLTPKFPPAQEVPDKPRRGSPGRAPWWNAEAPDRAEWAGARARAQFSNRKSCRRNQRRAGQPGPPSSAGAGPVHALRTTPVRKGRTTAKMNARVCSDLGCWSRLAASRTQSRPMTLTAPSLPGTPETNCPTNLARPAAGRSGLTRSGIASRLPGGARPGIYCAGDWLRARSTLCKAGAQGRRTPTCHAAALEFADPTPTCGAAMRGRPPLGRRPIRGFSMTATGPKRVRHHDPRGDELRPRAGGQTDKRISASTTPPELLRCPARPSATGLRSGESNHGMR